MSSSSSTTKSDAALPTDGDRPRGGPYRNHVLVTIGLLFTWVVLLFFGLLSATTPPWLVSLSDPGRRVESTDAKNLGDDALRQGNLGLAAAQYQHALKIRPDEGGAIVNLGIVLIKAGRVDEGERVLRDGLKITHSDVSRGLMLYTLGLLDEQRGNREAAMANYREAIACGTDLAKRYHRLGSLYLAAGQLDSAQVTFEKALAYQLDPASSYREMLVLGMDALEDDTVHVAVMRELLRQPVTENDLARYDLETIRQVQLQDTSVADTYNYLGWVAIQREDFAKATAYFEKSLEIWPGNRNAVENLRVLRQIEADARQRGAGS